MERIINNNSDSCSVDVTELRLKYKNACRWKHFLHRYTPATEARKYVFGKPNSFFAARRYATRYIMPRVCVCLSVSLSVTSRNSTKPSKPRITQTTPYDSLGTLVFFGQKNFGEIPTESPTTGAPNRRVVGSNRRFSTNISLYIIHGAR